MVHVDVDHKTLVEQCKAPPFREFLQRCHPDQQGKLTAALGKLEAGDVTEADLLAIQMALEIAQESDWEPGDEQQHRIQREEVADTDRLALLHPQRHANVRHSVHVYGHSAALCVEPTSHGEQGSVGISDPVVHTITFEMAQRKQEGGGYNWSQKIQFRLTRRELPLATAAVLGLIQEIGFSGHGPSKDKRLDIRNQPGKVFVRLQQRSTVLAVPITCEDLFMVGTRMLEALVRNTNGLDQSLVMQLVRRVAEVYVDGHNNAQ